MPVLSTKIGYTENIWLVVYKGACSNGPHRKHYTRNFDTIAQLFCQLVWRWSVTFISRATYTCKRGLYYGNVADWVTGCLTVTRRYCIKTTKPILKLFRPSGSPFILVFWLLAPIPNSKAEPRHISSKLPKWAWIVIFKPNGPNITRTSADADKPRNAFRGQSRSSNIVPFHMIG